MTKNNPYPYGSADHEQFEILRQLEFEQLLAVYQAGSKRKTRRRSSGALNKMIAEAVARDTR